MTNNNDQSTDRAIHIAAEVFFWLSLAVSLLGLLFLTVSVASGSSAGLLIWGGFTLWSGCWCAVWYITATHFERKLR